MPEKNEMMIIMIGRYFNGSLKSYRWWWRPFEERRSWPIAGPPKAETFSFSSGNSQPVTMHTPMCAYDTW